MTTSTPEPNAGAFVDGKLPANVYLGADTLVSGQQTFKRFFALAPDAAIIGEHSTLDGAHIAVGKDGRLRVGNYCHLSGCILLAELEIIIGNFVAIAWNATIADTDFHPIAPAERMADAVACSPLGSRAHRPPILRRAVIIEDDVWIGPNATILKGVRIGAGSVIEAGSLITKDVPPRSRIIGNPARVIETFP